MTEPIDRPCCGSCNCYVPDAAQLRRGFCHCLPPVPIVVAAPGPAGQGLIAVFPPVMAEGFCHQWRPRQAANDPVEPPPAPSRFDPACYAMSQPPRES